MSRHSNPQRSVLFHTLISLPPSCPAGCAQADALRAPRSRLCGHFAKRKPCGFTALSLASISRPGRHLRPARGPGRHVLPRPPRARHRRLWPSPTSCSQVELDGVTQVRFGDAIDRRHAEGSGEVVQTIAPPEFLAANSTFVTDLVQRGHPRRRRAADRPDVAELDRHGHGGRVPRAARLHGLSHHRRPHPVDLRRGPASPSAATTSITFQDVAGVDEAKDEVKEIVDFLREPGRFSAIGGRIPKGVLLVGPPGTGKTLLARSIAGEAGVPFLFASGSDFVEMYAGVGASRVRRLFRDARRHRPASSSSTSSTPSAAAAAATRSATKSASRRSTSCSSRWTASRVTRASSSSPRPTARTSSIRRCCGPGRFDRQVTVGNPDLKGREADPARPRAQGRARRRRGSAVDRARHARLLGRRPRQPGQRSGAVRRRAPAARRSSTRDLEEARDKVLMGVERRSIAMSEHDRVNCAYHEAGHAVVAALLPDADPLHKVTIIPRGRALGVTMQLPEADRHTYTKGYLETQIAVLMGGRVAEELFMSHMTSGASNDIERATDIARHMVCEWGMSALGPLAYPQAGQRLRSRPPARRQRSDRAARGRGDPQGRDARLRPRARDHREQSRAGARAGRGAAGAGVARSFRDPRAPGAGGRSDRIGPGGRGLNPGLVASHQLSALSRQHVADSESGSETPPRAVRRNQREGRKLRSHDDDPRGHIRLE